MKAQTILRISTVLSESILLMKYETRLRISHPAQVDGCGCAFEEMPEFHDTHIRWITDITIVTTSCWAGHTTSNSPSDLVVMSEASGSALISSL